MDLIGLMTRADEVQIDSAYRLVQISAQRARQLMRGARPKVNSKFVKETTVALHEALEHKIDYLTGKDARTAMRDARSLREPDHRPRVLPPPRQEDTAEIKKDLSVYVDDSPPELAESEAADAKSTKEEDL